MKLFSGHGWWVFWVGRGERVGRIVCVCVCMSDESPFFSLGGLGYFAFV